ncbi:ImmA/IrrE family metallo-endopeptidase [Streptomyces sp. NPDC047002]|uniref:ImmA/IrrE family metallo-endopeptidase n=1 Tax=Streptomyces sp. NPDC047002 TaxID=3155475 RepID=UPI003453A1BC
MRRGFKSEAERLADRVRTQLGVPSDASPDIRQLVEHLCVEVVDAQELVGMDSLRELEALQPGAFSAATFHLPGGRTVAVYNPCNEPARTKSDIAHELAHVLLGHEVRELQQIGGHTFFTCDPEQEGEANSLAACCSPVSFCSATLTPEQMLPPWQPQPASAFPWPASA